MAEAQEALSEHWGPAGHLSLPGPTAPASLPCPLPPPQGLERLQFLYLADNLLDSIPGPLPPSLRSLHLQVSSLPKTKSIAESPGAS